MGTKEEKESRLKLLAELKSKTKDEILKYGDLPINLSKSELIKYMASKPIPSKTTKLVIEKLLSNPIEESSKQKMGFYISSYSWWKDQDLEKKLSSALAIKPLPPIVTTKVHSKTNGITYTQLLTEIEKPVFIVKVANTIRDLIGYKYTKYVDLHQLNSKLYTNLKKRVDKLRDNGHSAEDISEIIPIYKNLASILLNLEDMIERLKNHKVTNLSVKNGLLVALTDKEYGLASLVGREEIKNIISGQIYSLSHGRFIFTEHFNNIRIYGGPGVGKTTLAKILGYVFSKIGILVKGDVRCVTAVDFIGSYIGQTAPKTVSLLMDSLESVLFVDEAYQLAGSTKSYSYASDSITEIVNFTDKYIGLGIIIVAGYEDRMGEFMKSNDGLLRRFPYLYNLRPYTNEELANILTIKLKKSLPSTIIIDENTKNFLLKIISKLGGRLKNQAGDMLNLASSISRSICSAYKVKWVNGRIKNNTVILLEGVNNFLLSLDGEIINGFDFGV